MLIGSLLVASALAFDAGADLRIRQEIMGNVPGLPGGGLMSRAPYGKTKNHLRFRPRVWTELKGETTDAAKWRLFARLGDEFRWNVNYRNRSNEFPDELYLDNLFLESTGLFDGLLDFSVGRQDLLFLYGLDHVFMDGTPGDGSRSAFTDAMRFTLHATDRSKLDVIALMDRDVNRLRWGTSDSRTRRETALGPSSEPEMDDWGLGVIWGSDLTPEIPYQLFAVSKRVSSWHDSAHVKHPGWFRELLGVKTTPQLTDDLSLQLEGMSQIGENDGGDFLSAWSAYAGGEWRDAARKTCQPFLQTGLHCMSGDKDAATEDGGHHGWDPMWSRAENDSCLFQYGTLYGVGYWSNMYFWKTAAGLRLSPGHLFAASTGPVFADQKDGLGGGEGLYKGLLSQARYEFPLWTNETRFKVFGHLIAEFFNPGDYYESDRPAWWVRWQVLMKF